MSSEEADKLMENFEKKWDAKHRGDFMRRMERKMHRRDQYGQV